MTDQPSWPVRRTVLRSIAVAGAGALAGCPSTEPVTDTDAPPGGTSVNCDPLPPSRQLALAVADGPVEEADGWRLDLSVEQVLVRVGDRPFEAARLRAYDADRELLADRELAPFDGEEYEVSSTSICGGTRYTYVGATTLRTDREPTYVNPFVPRSACSGVEESTHPLVLGEDWDPRFGCGQRFPFAVLDVDEAPVHDRGDWPTARFGAARTGRNPNGAGPTDPSRECWTAAVGEEASTPVVEYGAVFVTTGTVHPRDAGRSFDHDNLAAFDLATGELGWVAERGGAEPGLAVADGLVFAGHRGLAAFDAATGRERWRSADDADLATTPTVPGDVVCIVDEDGVARAYATEDGQALWAREVGAPRPPDGPSFDPVPTIAADDSAFYVQAAGVVRGLATETGAPLWDGPDPVPPGVPMVADGTVYAPRTNALAALSTDTGAERWSHELPDTPRTCAVGPEAVYVATGEAVHAVDRGDGTRRWDGSFEADTWIRGLVGGSLYVTAQRRLHVLDPATGERTALGDDPEVRSPVVAGGRLVDVTPDGELRVLADE